LGCSKSAAKKQLRLLTGLSSWLDEQGLELAALTTGLVEPFFEQRRRAGCSNLRTRRALVPLTGYLRRVGGLDEAEAEVVTDPVGLVVATYRVYLFHERGLVEGTVAGYVRVARAFLAERLGVGGSGLEGLLVREVTDFAARVCGPLGLSASRQTVSALRCLLRYLALEGLTAVTLEGVVLSVAGGGSRLPRGIEPTAVDRILKGCDRRRAIGRRDYAMLMLLARLGLRGGEVVGLELDDIDWRCGEIVVSGKGGRRDRLPLPFDVGEAIAGYLTRGRPRNDSRKVFVGSQAPFGEFRGTGALRGVMARACARAGVAYASPHRLRHSAATGMLAAGSSLSAANAPAHSPRACRTVWPAAQLAHR
jgi:integrase/recombinase XerD